MSVARAPSASDAASRAGLRGLWSSLSGSWAAGASALSAAAPWGAWAADFAWAAASSALLLALPLVVEIQREATVRWRAGARRTARALSHARQATRRDATRRDARRLPPPPAASQVRVLQHQREIETAQLQEQARAQAGGLLQQAQALGNLIAGPAPQPPTHAG